jgi:predicted DCC family thiol-disulfide oxidoreductase YuxK
VRRRDHTSRVLVLPNQIPNLINQYGLSRTQVDRELWAVALDGTRWSGAEAINRTLRELGCLWPWVAAMYQIKPFRLIEDLVYRWFARHRTWLSRWFGATPEWKD